MTEVDDDAGQSLVAIAAQGRWKKRHTFMTLIVLAFLAGAGALIAMRFRKGWQFKAESEQVFVLIRDGKAEQVYEQSSGRFKQSEQRTVFLSMVENLRQTLGGYRSIVAIRRVFQTDTVQGRVGNVQLTVEFERGTADGSLSFLRDSAGVYRLLSFYIDVPLLLQKEAKRVREKNENRLAPPEVVELPKKIIDQLSHGQSQTAWQESSTVFQSTVTAQELGNVWHEYEVQLGKYQEFVKVVSAVQNGNQDRASVQAMLAFANERTTAEFEFMLMNADWKLSRFSIALPEARLPAHLEGRDDNEVDETE